MIFGKNIPRLLSEEKGYDWREFDNWLRKIHDIIGNNPLETLEEQASKSMTPILSKISRMEAQIEDLDRKIKGKTAELQMLTNRIEDIERCM